MDTRLHTENLQPVIGKGVSTYTFFATLMRIFECIVFNRDCIASFQVKTVYCIQDLCEGIEMP